MAGRSRRWRWGKASECRRRRSQGRRHARRRPCDRRLRHSDAFPQRHRLDRPAIRQTRAEAAQGHRELVHLAQVGGLHRHRLRLRAEHDVQALRHGVRLHDAQAGEDHPGRRGSRQVRRQGPLRRHRRLHRGAADGAGVALDAVLGEIHGVQDGLHQLERHGVVHCDGVLVHHVLREDVAGAGGDHRLGRDGRAHDDPAQLQLEFVGGRAGPGGGAGERRRSAGDGGRRSGGGRAAAAPATAVSGTPTPFPSATAWTGPPSDKLELKLRRVIVSSSISPKSVVSTGTGYVFAQNMMYKHSVTVYDSMTLKLVKTIQDAVDLAKYGVKGHSGAIRGAPVEAAMTPEWPLTPYLARSTASWMVFTSMSVMESVSYTHLRAHETDSYLVCRLLLEKKKK